MRKKILNSISLQFSWRQREVLRSWSFRISSWGAPCSEVYSLSYRSFFSPHDTPFEDGTFKLTIEFTEEYPNKPPTVRFVSKMFHPNGKSNIGLESRWTFCDCWLEKDEKNFARGWMTKHPLVKWDVPGDCRLKNCEKECHCRSCLEKCAVCRWTISTFVDLHFCGSFLSSFFPENLCDSDDLVGYQWMYFSLAHCFRQKIKWQTCLARTPEQKVWFEERHQFRNS